MLSKLLAAGDSSLTRHVLLQPCGRSLIAAIFNLNGVSTDGPHILRVDPVLDFATIVVAIETYLTPLPLRERGT
jgi:hypothetical protein